MKYTTVLIFGLILGLCSHKLGTPIQKFIEKFYYNGFSVFSPFVKIGQYGGYDAGATVYWPIVMGIVCGVGGGLRFNGVGNVKIFSFLMLGQIIASLVVYFTHNLYKHPSFSGAFLILSIAGILFFSVVSTTVFFWGTVLVKTKF